MSNTVEAAELKISQRPGSTYWRGNGAVPPVFSIDLGMAGAMPVAVVMMVVVVMVIVSTHD